MTTALTTLAGALGSGKREPSDRPQYQSATAVIASAVDRKQAKQALQNAREERLYNLLTQPEILGFVMALGGFYLSNNIRFSPDDGKNTLLQGVGSTASVAMGMGFAGTGDLATLSVAGMAGGASIFGSLFGEAISDVTEGGTNIVKWLLFGPFSLLMD